MRLKPKTRRRSVEFDIYSYVFCCALLLFGLWLLGGY